MGRKYYSRTDRRDPPKRTSLSVGERVEWAREQWRRDPTISVNGKGGMYELMMEVFGVAVMAGQLQQIKERVVREMQQRGNGAPLNPVLTQERLQAAQAAGPKKVVVPPKPPSAPIPAADTPPASDPPPVFTRLGSGRSIADARERLRFAATVANPRMTVRDLANAVRSEFGIGIGGVETSEILIRIRGEAGVATYRKRRAADGATKAPLTRRGPAAASPPVPPPAVAAAPSAESQIRAAIELIFAEVPGLVSLEVRRGPDGRPQASFKVETVQSGRFDL